MDAWGLFAWVWEATSRWKGSNLEQICIQILPLQLTPAHQEPVCKVGKYEKQFHVYHSSENPLPTRGSWSARGLVWDAALSPEFVKNLPGNSHMQQNLSAADLLSKCTHLYYSPQFRKKPEKEYVKVYLINI